MLFVAVIRCASAAPDAPARESADLVLKDATVYTVDASRPWAHAVAIRAGRIVAVGSDADVHAYVGPHTHIVDLHGRLVLPGFHDSHIHLAEGGLELTRCVLSDCNNLNQIRQAIRNYVQHYRKKDWVIGTGWDVAVFPGGSPTRQELDRLIPDRPAFFASSDGHSAWVNTRALRMAQIDAHTAAPENGRIERDTRGEPSGTLRERAMDLVMKWLPPTQPEDALRGLLKAQAIANRFGIVSIQDAHAAPDFLAAYRAADARHLLKVRVVAALHTFPDRDESQVDELIAQRNLPTLSGLLRVTAAKIFLDGVVESHTAALLAPYSDRPQDSGSLNMQPPALQRLVTRLDKEGFEVHVHAIGDRAVREALNAFEAARKANGVHDSRHTIAHLQLVDPQDVPRFAALGVVANFQCFWMQNDADVQRLDLPALGSVRNAHQYPIADVARTGAVVVGGSDWSVTSMNPLDAIEVAITHCPLDDAHARPWIPEQRVSLPFMLKAYTLQGAWLNKEDTETGSITAGKSADLIVLDRNLFKIPARQIHKTRVLLTMLAGRPVYRSPGVRW